MVDCGPVLPPSCLHCGDRGCVDCPVPVTRNQLLHDVRMDWNGTWRTGDGHPVAGIVSATGADPGDPDEQRVLVEMLRTLRPGQTLALPSGAHLRRSTTHHYRPTDGSPALSPETSAMMDQDNQRDLAKFNRYPDWQGALRHLRAQLVQMTGVPPMHMDVGCLVGPGVPTADEAAAAVAEPYATDRHGNVWRLDADERAYSATSDLRPPIATMIEHADREVAQRVAGQVAEREREIRDQLADAHERATGARPYAAHRQRVREQQRADDEQERATREHQRTEKAWLHARNDELGQRRAYIRAMELPGLHTRNRAYAARTAAISAPAGVLLYVGADVANSVLLAILAAVAVTLAVCAAVRVVSEHRQLARVDAERIEPARRHYDDACVRLGTAEIAYVLAGGDPWVPSGEVPTDAESA